MQGCRSPKPDDRIRQTDRKKPDGKIFWDLVNADMSGHIHKTTVVLPDIEEPLPKTDQKVNPGNVIDHTNEVMLRMCLALEDIAKTLKNSGSCMLRLNRSL